MVAEISEFTHPKPYDFSEVAIGPEIALQSHCISHDHRRKRLDTDCQIPCSTEQGSHTETVAPKPPLHQTSALINVHQIPYLFTVLNFLNSTIFFFNLKCKNNWRKLIYSEAGIRPRKEVPPLNDVMNILCGKNPEGTAQLLN